MGWIGKLNLLVTPGYISALSMCTVLTNAPLNTILQQPMNSQCGGCRVCEQNAIKGKNWTRQFSREDIIDISKCKSCIECLVHCPFTQKYIRNNR